MKINNWYLVKDEVIFLITGKQVEYVVDWIVIKIINERIFPFVFRMHANGSNALAKPCEFCIPMLLHKNLRHVYYSIDSGFRYLDLRTL